MEIEAKFSVPDRETLQKLEGVDRLGDYRLGAASLEHMRDRYMDTHDRKLLQAGYFCRLRFKAQGILVTVKGAGTIREGVHERPEYEVTLDRELPVNEWPPSTAREMVTRLALDAPLVQLFTLEQARDYRRVSAGERAVADLSFDQVEMDLPGAEHRYYEMEIELLPDGRIEDLQTLAGIVRHEWQLQPENRSKFERALALLDHTG